MGKRVFLFLAVNVLVVATISIVLNVLGVRPYLDANGINYQALLIFCSVWGMGGAFISLLLSKKMAKWSMGVKIIDPNTTDQEAQRLVQTVHRLAQVAGLPKMPEVGYYESPEINAFATGPSKSNSLVVVSSSLLQRMDGDAVEGVLGHEVAHIANGDMVTMTLIQGVVNAFVMFLARIVAFAVSQMGSDREEGGGINYLTYMLTTIVFDIVFSILGSVVVAWFSRFREFKADAGGARLAGRDKMIRALQGLQRAVELDVPEQKDKGFQSLKISSRGGFLALFSTHPPLETRIRRLESATSF